MTFFRQRHWLIALEAVGLLLLFIAVDIFFISRSESTSPSSSGVPFDSLPIANEEFRSSSTTLPTLTVPLTDFVEVAESCGPAFTGACVYGHMHIDGELVPVKQLREGMVLRVGTSTVRIHEEEWYPIIFDEWIRYPERLTSELYVRASNVRHFLATSTTELTKTSTSTKRIIVDRSEQMLRAYDGDTLFMEEKTSTGIDATPTPRGTFTVFRKTPSRYMQGPLPGVSEKEYDLPGVPWNLYFTEDGAVIHGAYWHNSFGTQWSNGCVNLPPKTAEKLYEWTDVGTTVVVRD
jgi:lipoprotein-anchoring transpeptidase ErfK/SrfK